MLGQACEKVQSQKAAENGDVDEGRFFRSQIKDHRRGEKVEPVGAAFEARLAVQILQDAIRHNHAEKD